jgi:tRNA nucleotidyltransferase/poly(A) polymerase
MSTFIKNFGNGIYYCDAPIKGDLNKFRSLGIKRILSLDENVTNNYITTEDPRTAGIEYLVYHISPWNPSQGANRVMNDILKIASVKPLLIHCKQGQDRTGFALAAWLVRNGKKPCDAVKHIEQLTGYGRGISPQAKKTMDGILGCKKEDVNNADPILQPSMNDDFSDSGFFADNLGYSAMTSDPGNENVIGIGVKARTSILKRILKMASEEIKLTDHEQKIINLLKDVIATKSPDTVLRIAGGWVRDKILGKDSNDIDISVNNMSGLKFAELVNEYLSEHGDTSGKIAVIEANPDQSKHLETATVKIFGIPIDFVQLRSETYGDSRIPTVTIGTPEEDAERRDLTINALFYNINTGSVEDLVGGSEDLKNKIARTPMDPVKTFLDDPLRILRTIRFAAKYDLELAPEIIQAAHNPSVIDAFKNKISQERIWTEIAGKKEPVLDNGEVVGYKWKPGALIGANPTKAAQLLKQLGLFEIIFNLTDKEKEELKLDKEFVAWDTDQNNPHHKYSILEHTLSVVKSLVDKTKQDIKEDQETYLVRNLAALLHDIGKTYTGIQGKHEKGHTTYHGHEGLSASIAEKILNRLHAPKDIIERVVKLIKVHLQPHVLSGEGSDKHYRKFVKDFPDWEHSVELAEADYAGKGFGEETPVYNQLRENIQKAIGPGNSINIKRPINGKDISDLGIKPGPIFKKIFDVIDDKLLENPSLTKDEALSIAKSMIGDTNDLQVGLYDNYGGIPESYINAPSGSPGAPGAAGPIQPSGLVQL